jgi:hypothetical protein
MYDVRPNLIIGFHGCEKSVRDKLLKNPSQLSISEKPFDWLRHGMYFWENNLERARLWSEDKKRRGEIKSPAVIGAIINLGYCLDFLDSKFIKLIEANYHTMVKEYAQLGKVLPKNKDIAADEHKDKILRDLDCAVIEYVHTTINQKINEDFDNKDYSDYKRFDSTRGVYIEGGGAFPGAGIAEKSHIQVCIRNPNCIKGFFLPRTEVKFEH